MARLIPLGVNGLSDCYGRHTMCFLVLTERDAIVFDAGTGLGRLIEKTTVAELEDYDRLHIVLSHYHLDHVAGLFSLIEWPYHKPIITYAPSPPLVDCSAKEALQDLWSSPYLGKPLDDILENLTVRPFANLLAGLTVGDCHLRLRRNRHTGGSVSFRWGDKFAYVTDTPADDETIDFVRGVDLLLHEVWLTDEEAESEPGEIANHSSVSGVARIAQEAGVNQLMPIHLRPHEDESRPDIIFHALSEAASGFKVLYPREEGVVTIRSQISVQ